MNSKPSLSIVLFISMTYNLIGKFASGMVDYEQCFNSMGCFGATFDSSGSPAKESCIKTKNCDIVVSYRNISNGDIIFAIRGNIRNPPYYLAVALSGDSKMGDDSVMFCYDSGSKQDIGESKNEGHNSFHLGAKSNLYDTKISIIDGYLSCSFTRNKTTTIEINSKKIIFDLRKSYHLLLALGDYDEGLQHHTSKISSEEKLDFRSKKEIGAILSKFAIVSSHGSLMIIAWMMFACLGTFTARYMFHGFPENAGFYWFQIHQICMWFTWLLSIAGALIQFIGTGKGPLIESLKLRTNPHAIVGLVSLMMMFIQPFMGVLRPSPNSKKRIIFNRVHHFIGNAATVLALSAIVSATFFEGRGIPYESRYVSCGFLIFYIGCHLSMTLGNKIRCAKLRDLAPYRYMFALVGMVAFITALLYMLLKDLN